MTTTQGPTLQESRPLSLPGDGGQTGWRASDEEGAIGLLELSGSRMGSSFGCLKDSRFGNCFSSMVGELGGRRSVSRRLGNDEFWTNFLDIKSRSNFS
jgi:hypothetical protein